MPVCAQKVGLSRTRTTNPHSSWTSGPVHRRPWPRHSTSAQPQMPSARLMSIVYRTSSSLTPHDGNAA